MLKKLKPSKKFILGIFFILFLVLSMPLIQRAVVYLGHDSSYHFNRVQNIADAIGLGIFPAKIHVSCFNKLNSFGNTLRCILTL